jgi:hypothetical protein
MAMGNFTNTTRRTVVGYFADAEDAQRAIDELIAEGFSPADIGAAFHSGNSNTSAVSGIEEPGGIDAGSTGMELHPEVGLYSPDSSTTTAGAGSDSNAVTPAGLSTGSGSVITGASRPGPIPGAEIPGSIPSSLPHSIHSTLPSSLSPAGTAHAANEGVVTSGDYSAGGAAHEAYRHSGSTNWREKLKHVFGAGDNASTDHRTLEVAASKGRTDFGTGEGQLGISTDYEYAYSGAAFESAFFGMGVAPAYAQHLAVSIRRGGAIVTVDSAGTSKDAEEILERNGARVREEAAASASSSASEDAWSDANRGDRVQLFGKVQQVYPGYVSSTGEATRKAS